MPIIAAVLGAIMTGLLYWFLWGGGMAYVDNLMREGQDKKRRLASAKLKLEGERDRAAAPLRSLTDPREAATVLMVAAALIRGVPTPEQEETIRGQMRDVLGSGTDLETQLSFCRFAAEQVPTPEATIDDLADLLRRSLDPAERDELRVMLDRVVALHGGPTDRQEAFVALVGRRIGGVA